jgi:phosphatidylinositol glycan class B
MAVLLSHLHSATLETYKDQTDVFYEDPPAYLQARFPAIVDPTFPPAPCPMTTTPACSWQHEWPRFLVLFGALLDEPRINATLTEKGYTQTWHGMNGFEEDTRRRGGVCVWQWQSSP